MHEDSYVSIEQSIPNEITKQFASSQIEFIEKEIPSTTINSDCLPLSGLFWPRKGQTLDNYIREYDSQTHTHVEKVEEFF